MSRGLSSIRSMRAFRAAQWHWENDTPPEFEGPDCEDVREMEDEEQEDDDDDLA